MWDDRVTRPLTVRPILQASADLSGFRLAHLTCNTLPEFEHNLALLRRRRGFGVLYLASHGAPGRLVLPSAELTLEELAERMGQGFRGRIVHLGACSTVRVAKERLADFAGRTGVAMVLGYERDVAWLEACSVELLLLDHLQNYVDTGRAWSSFLRRYSELVRITGLTAYPARG